MAKRPSTTKGFKAAGMLLSRQLRRASERRGFMEHRLLTHWPDVAGPELAAQTRPVQVSYGRGSLGATLTVLTSGAIAPLVEMQKQALLTRINSIYGYPAIRRIRVTQTAATGFAEPQAAFAPAPEPAAKPLSPACASALDAVRDPGLRAALTRLGYHVSKHRTQTR